MSRSRSGPVTGALVAAGLSLALVRSEGRWPRAVREPMLRRNFAGREVTLAEGPAWVIGAAGGALVAADPAAALVVAAPGVVGLVDDLVGDTAVKGLAGHLRALRRGRVTSGVLKIGVLAVSAIVAATHDRGARGVSSAPRLQTLADAGVIAIASMVSPLRSDREIARELHRAADLDFIEVHVSTPVTECERRDPKGLYERARRGELRGLTGIDAPYESPESPDLRFDTTGADIDRLASLILGALMDRGIMAG